MFVSDNSTNDFSERLLNRFNCMEDNTNTILYFILLTKYDIILYMYFFSKHLNFIHSLLNLVVKHKYCRTFNTHCGTTKDE